MTNSEYTHITLVVDRSGSMWDIQSDAQGAINKFIADQQALPGKATFTLVDFNQDVHTVLNHVVLSQVKNYRLVPGGSTALLDAWGSSMDATGAWLAGLPEDERPGKVVFAVVTDGFENASKEYTRARVKQLTETQRNEFAWEVVFLAANQDAIFTGAQLGVDAASSLSFAASAQGTQSSYDSFSTAVRDYRVTGKKVGFTKEDRENASS